MTISTSTDNNYFHSHDDKCLDKSFAAIDWQAPWVCHLNQLSNLSKAIKQLSHVETLQSAADRSTHSDNYQDIIAQLLNEALSQQSESEKKSLPTTMPTTDNPPQVLKFVSQDALPAGVGYEQFIANTGQIPTRDNLHDLFNGSIWLTFPKTKALLNYHHMLEIDKYADEPNGSKNRGRVRDTITVFDENGAVLVTAEPSIGEALINFDWQNSLVKPRKFWDNPTLPNQKAKAAVYIFGHALLEQLIEPRKPLCAHSVVIHAAQDFFALSTVERIRYLDDKLAEYMDDLLSQDNITPRQLAPLPILGVPYFWAENGDVSFYEDSYVFRSGRHRQQRQ